MDRREFVATGMGGVLSASAPRASASPAAQSAYRALFPRLAGETFINAAGGTPLGAFAESGLQRYMAFQRLGPGDERGDYVAEMHATVRELFARLIGARAGEIALVHSTKAGEQVVIDGLDPGRHGRNIVTNDMHFSGSLHNLIGLGRAGTDVRIVRGTDWDVPLEAMATAIDDDTALVAVTLVSNVTGRIEAVAQLAEIAHAHGALLYADVIQAAGIVPLDVRALGIDFAAANGYKWLFGVHGAGFLFVRAELQGTRLPDRLFPGHVQYNYPPWVGRPNVQEPDYLYTPPRDAARYEPGHVSYLGYCAAYEGLKFLHEVGIERALEHSVRLCGRLQRDLDPDRYTCISPHVNRSPIITFLTDDARALGQRLRDAHVVVTLAGNRVRISPALYNDDRDIDRLLEVMNA